MFAWRAMTLVIILVGAIQLIFLIIDWFIDGQIIIASFASLIASSCILLWYKDIPVAIKGARDNDDQALF